MFYFYMFYYLRKLTVLLAVENSVSGIIMEIILDFNSVDKEVK